MTKILPIRLNEKEFQMLDEILSSENCESENRSEWIRLLIHREWNRRKKLGVPSSADFATVFRLGNHVEGHLRRRKCNTAKLISQRKPDSVGASRLVANRFAPGRDKISASRSRRKRLVKTQ